MREPYHRTFSGRPRYYGIRSDFTAKGAAVMAWGRVLSGAGVVLLLAGSVSGQTRDIDGRSFTPFAPAGKASVLLFVQTDCPISNSYAPEIQRVCKAYESKGVSCSLAYEDVRVDAASVRKHIRR